MGAIEEILDEREEAAGLCVIDAVWAERKAQVAAARAELAAMVEERERLRRALEFYALSDRYVWMNELNTGLDAFTPIDEPYLMDMMRDMGRLARAALTGRESGK